MLADLLLAALITERHANEPAAQAESVSEADGRVPAPGSSWVVEPGEDPVVREEDMYRSGVCATEAALPEGYPAPTAPGAIEIKSYPTVRRAQVSGQGSTASSQRGFWPLFQHIQRNEIAMTAPVEMIYDGMTPADDPSDHTVGEGDDWTMSFLYRSFENGPTGTDGSVEIIDAEPVTVLAVGVRGVLWGPTIRERAGELMAWIEDSDEWEIAGDLRTFGYNGPYVPNDRKWWEVQIPIRPTNTDSDSERRPL
ncbi:MAG: heme-binding protein [Phycisphaerales bacterium]